MIKFLTVAAGVVSLAAIVVVVHFSSHDWKSDYAPNLAVAIAEVTVGAALVAGYLSIRRRVRKSHLQRLVDGQIFQAVARLLSVVQASYIEAAEKPVPSVPLTVREVLDRWRTEVKSLDLRRPTTHDSSVRWATYLPTEVLGALIDLASVVARFPDLTEEVIDPLVELEVHDDFVTLLRHLPDHGPTRAPGQPATLVSYFGWFPVAAPVALESFTARVKKLADLAEKRGAGRPLFDEYSWIDSIPPLWGSGRHRPEEDLREQAPSGRKLATAKRATCALLARALRACARADDR